MPAVLATLSEGTASESCFVFRTLKLRDDERDGLAGEVSESDDGEDSADADDGTSRGGGLGPVLRGGLLLGDPVLTSRESILRGLSVDRECARRERGRWRPQPPADQLQRRMCVLVCCVQAAASFCCSCSLSGLPPCPQSCTLDFNTSPSARPSSTARLRCLRDQLAALLLLSPPA